MTEHWTGAAAICIDDQNRILMVLQGKADEEKKWSAPSGGRLPNETFEECCKREVFEETGLIVEVLEEIYVKRGIVHYFMVDVVGGKLNIQDPDELIYDISWKTIEEVCDLNLSFEEDRNMIIALLQSKLERGKSIDHTPYLERDVNA